MLTDYVNSFKNKQCSDCGIKYPNYVMEFDHRDPKIKYDSINRMIHFHSSSKIKILEEINKCDLVCANCHRLRTYKNVVK